MATEKRGPDLSASFVASGDLSTHQYKWVVFNEYDVFLSGSATGPGGVLQNKPRDNEHAGVVQAGYTKLVMAQSLASAQEIMAGANGFGTATASGAWVIGHSLTSADSGMLCEIFVNQYKRGA